uniref:helix-turn-helix domain-containing protein n=1 Tax=Acidithiobacillus caldus TaxID=33059 RepID=UPI001C075A41|nr:helix-turn-helix domain-containing protein [Acidithiobacillus caldus]
MDGIICTYGLDAHDKRCQQGGNRKNLILIPQHRNDRGCSKLPAPVQEAILQAKRNNPRRSIRQIRQLLESTGLVAQGSVSHSAVHRLLQQQGLSQMTGSASQPEEKHSFVAESVGAIYLVWRRHACHPPRSRERPAFVRHIWSPSWMMPPG